jgi:hypothetical protein
MVEINCDLSAKTLLLGVPFPRLLTGTTDSILSSITAQNLYHTLENVLYTCVNLLELYNSKLKLVRTTSARIHATSKDINICRWIGTTISRSFGPQLRNQQLKTVNFHHIFFLNDTWERDDYTNCALSMYIAQLLNIVH